MNKSQNHYVKWKKPDIKEYTWYNSIYLKFWNNQKKSISTGSDFSGIEIVLREKGTRAVFSIMIWWSIHKYIHVQNTLSNIVIIYFTVSRLYHKLKENTFLFCLNNWGHNKDIYQTAENKRKRKIQMSALMMSSFSCDTWSCESWMT